MLLAKRDLSDTEAGGSDVSSFRRNLYPSLAIGLAASLPMSALVFNVLPQAGLAAAPIVCRGAFIIVPSVRRTSHAYLCQASGAAAPADVTFLATALTWFFLWIALALVTFAVFAIVFRKKPAD
jgi:hypothetical protein